MSIDYTVPASWIAPNQRFVTPACHRRCREAVEALGGRPVRARYWADSGWFISANEWAVPPYSVGDRQWSIFVPEYRAGEEWDHRATEQT